MFRAGANRAACLDENEDGRPVSKSSPATRDGRFLRFSAAGVLHLAAQNALIYGLFIIIVGSNASALSTSAFVLTATVPSILFGLAGGVAADVLPRKVTLLASLALRAAVVVWLLRFNPGVSAVVGGVFVLWTIDQFYSPAECAALASVVDERHVGRASAITNGLALVAQVLGAGLIAPFALRLLGADGLFAIVLALVGGAFLLLATIPRLTTRRAPDQGTLRSMPSLRRGWHTIRASAPLFRSVMLFVLLDSALVIVVVAAPSFINDVLDVSTENAVYIFAPAAIGVFVGLLVAPVCVRILPSSIVALLGFGLFLGVVGALPFIHAIAREVDTRSLFPLHLAEDWLHVSREIAATALLLPLAGIGVTLVRVASKTAIYEHTPHDVMAQVFATRGTIDSVATLLPTVAAGLVLQSMDVRPVLVATSVVTAMLAIGLLAFQQGRHHDTLVTDGDLPLQVAAS